MPGAFRKAGAVTAARRGRPNFQQKITGGWAPQIIMELKRLPEGVGTAGSHFRGRACAPPSGNTLQPTVSEATKTALKAKCIRAGRRPKAKTRSVRNLLTHVERERLVKGVSSLKSPRTFSLISSLSNCHTAACEAILKTKEKVRD